MAALVTTIRPQDIRTILAADGIVLVTDQMRALVTYEDLQSAIDTGLTSPQATPDVLTAALAIADRFEGLAAHIRGLAAEVHKPTAED
jgi:hypothetical protein